MKIINISQVRVACISPYLQLFWDLGIHTYILGIFFSKNEKHRDFTHTHKKYTNLLQECNEGNQLQK